MLLINLFYIKQQIAAELVAAEITGQMGHSTAPTPEKNMLMGI